MKKIIELETTFTPYTLDTYQTFTFETTEEYIIATENDRRNPIKTLEYDDFEWNYDYNSYLEKLAFNLIHLLQENILDDIILSITSDMKIISPKEYNFSTNKIFIDFNINIDKLNLYIIKHQEQYDKEKLKSCDGFMWFGDEHQTKLNFYLSNISKETYSSLNYYYDQIEQINSEDFVTYKLIKQK